MNAQQVKVLRHFVGDLQIRVEELQIKLSALYGLGWVIATVSALEIGRKDRHTNYLILTLRRPEQVDTARFNIAVVGHFAGNGNVIEPEDLEAKLETYTASGWDVPFSVVVNDGEGASHILYFLHKPI